MLPLSSEVSKRRKNLGLNQKQLAKLSGVSQSLIAKIERETVNPSYSKMKAVFDALESLERKRDIKARQILQSRVVGIQGHEFVAKAVKVMHESGYSQLPVFNGKQPIGSVSERTILNEILKGKDLKEISKMVVEDVMEGAFVSVDESTPLSVVSAILQQDPAVLVMKKGEVQGIITKADLLKVISS